MTRILPSRVWALAAARATERDTVRRLRLPRRAGLVAARLVELYQLPTILIAEDDDGHARLMEKNLRRAGLANDIKR